MTKIPLGVTDLVKGYRLKFDVYLSPEQIATNFVKVLDAQDLPMFLGTVQWTKVEKFFLDLANEEKVKLLS